MRLVSSNGSIYYFHSREVGFTRRFIVIIYYFHGREVGFTRRCIITIITTTPFDVEGREVGIPRFMMGIWYIVGIWYGTLLVYGMVHRWYMVWYIVGLYGMVHR